MLSVMPPLRRTTRSGAGSCPLAPRSSSPSRCAPTPLPLVSPARPTQTHHSPALSPSVSHDGGLTPHRISLTSPQGVHHRADLWPEPMKFDPSRFLRDDGKDHDDPFAFLPFIQGPRNCLGQHLALLEARLVLGTIIKARRGCTYVILTVRAMPRCWILRAFSMTECVLCVGRPSPAAVVRLQVRPFGRRAHRHEDDPDRTGARDGDDGAVEGRAMRPKSQPSQLRERDRSRKRKRGGAAKAGRGSQQHQANSPVVLRVTDCALAGRRPRACPVACGHNKQLTTAHTRQSGRCLASVTAALWYSDISRHWATGSSASAGICLKYN